ncbi:MAG TPA: hypothetical protein VGR64_05110 [Terracidiphilus sp.]|nr:hypothetical protein [Terracidiphilus sp.]
MFIASRRDATVAVSTVTGAACADAAALAELWLESQPVNPAGVTESTPQRIKAAVDIGRVGNKMYLRCFIAKSLQKIQDA